MPFVCGKAPVTSSHKGKPDMDEMPTRPSGDDWPGGNSGEGGAGRPPVFNMPGGILLCLAVLTAMYVVQSTLLSQNSAEWLVIEFGFSPLRYVYGFSEQGYEWLWTPLTYSFLHGSLEHLAFNGLWLAAFGTPVLRRIGGWRFAALWVVSAVGGAFMHAIVNWGQPTLMIGASGVISALMGAACRFAFGAGRSVRFQPDQPLPRLSVVAALRERTVVAFIAVWLFGNLVIAIGLPLLGALSGAVAWDAHIGGFLVGFLGFAVFDRPQGRD